MVAAASLPTVVRPHPGGRKGAMLSLDEVARRAWKSRSSPKLRAWATQQLNAAGYPTRIADQVQALVDAFRRKAGGYVADPTMVEFMAAPEQTLCLDEAGLCLMGYDCDDAAITCMALCLSVGVPHVWAVGASYKDPNVPTHVFFAFADEQGQKVRADPTTDLPVGTIRPTPVREWWVDPSKGIDASTLAGGVFVGIGGRGPRGERAAHLEGWGDWQSLSFGGRPIVGLGDDTTWPHEVYEYRRIWDPYMTGVVAGLRQCADAIQLQSDTLAPTDASRAQTLKLYADGARGNADFLATEWNAYAGWTEWQVMQNAASILAFFQKTVLQAGAYAKDSGSSCPAVSFPEPVPLEQQNAIILALQDANIVTTGTLQLLGIGAGGALQAVGDATKTLLKPVQDLASAANSPWPWIALTAAAAAVVVFEVWPQLRPPRQRAA